MGRPQLLILGGDSFIARSFIKYHQVDIEVKCISRKKTGCLNEMVLSDLTEIPDKYFINIDIVFNCIGIAHRKDKVSSKLYEKVNHRLAVSFAEKAKRKGVGIFIQMSTIAVYGSQKKIDYSTDEKPENNYGLSKLLADRALLKLNSVDFKVILIRPPMIYGEGAPGNMRRLINLVKSNIPLPFADIANKRDFLYIRNLVDAIEYIITAEYRGVLLISDNNAISTSLLLEHIYSLSHKKRRLFKVPIIIHKLLKLIKPDIYNKLFESLEIDIMQSKKYLPDGYPRYNLIDGLYEMMGGDSKIKN